MGEHRQELVLAAVGIGEPLGPVAELPLQLAAGADVVEDQDHAVHRAVGAADGGGAVVDGPLGAVAGDEHGVVGQPDDDPLAEDAGHGALDRAAVLLVDDPEDLVERPAGGLFASPSRS